MIKFLLSVILTLAAVTTTAQGWQQSPPHPIQQCVQHSPWGFAESRHQLQPLCRTGYLSAYDPAAKIPNWVAYTLLPQNALGCQPRGNDFVADRSVRDGARPEDYTGTGYDRGHAAPDGDLAWSEHTQRESYLMTNMYPQAGSLNRGAWKLLETTVRGWAVQQNAPYTIYVGAIYTPQDKTIGRGVVVPSTYYKIAVNGRTGQYAAWAFPHRPPYPNLGNDLTKLRVSVRDITTNSGVTFKFPPGATELLPGQEWRVDFGALTDSKRATCKK